MVWLNLEVSMENVRFAEVRLDNIYTIIKNIHDFQFITVEPC